jgi:predicted RNA-binding protein YlqC (UPF0109 family)
MKNDGTEIVSYEEKVRWVRKALDHICVSAVGDTAVHTRLLPRSEPTRLEFEVVVPDDKVGRILGRGGKRIGQIHEMIHNLLSANFGDRIRLKITVLKASEKERAESLQQDA